MNDKDWPGNLLPGPENEPLRKALDALERIRELEAEVENLRRCCREEVWHWQGDGYDFPESLSCPVIMDADTARKLLKASGYSDETERKAGKLEAENAELRERLEEHEGQSVPPAIPER